MYKRQIQVLTIAAGLPLLVGHSGGFFHKRFDLRGCSCLLYTSHLDGHVPGLGHALAVLLRPLCPRQVDGTKGCLLYTSLDAIRYCLTTNRNFNALGNKKSGRTLQGSVHAKQRGENAYRRPGHTVAYIGAEFWDSVKRAPFVIAVRVESEGPMQELHPGDQTLSLIHICRPAAATPCTACRCR